MKSALFVIDFINDLVNPKGKLAYAATYINENRVIEQANRAIQWMREKNQLILFVKVGFSPTYIEAPKNSPVFNKARELEALQLNTWGTAFDDRLDYQTKDTVIVKHRVSPFYGTDLELILHANQIDTVILSGVSTNMAIASAAREAHDRDFQVIILKDACGAVDAKIQNASLETLSRVASIMTLNEWQQKH